VTCPILLPLPQLNLPAPAVATKKILPRRVVFCPPFPISSVGGGEIFLSAIASFSG
jgi:hypothetical protein